MSYWEIRKKYRETQDSDKRSSETLQHISILFKLKFYENKSQLLEIKTEFMIQKSLVENPRTGMRTRIGRIMKKYKFNPYHLQLHQELRKLLPSLA